MTYIDTKYERDRDGKPVGESFVPLPRLGQDRALLLRTGKGSRGLSTLATVVKMLPDRGTGFTGYSFVMFQDFSKRVASDPGRGTEKAVRALHELALSDLDALLVEIYRYYEKEIA